MNIVIIGCSQIGRLMAERLDESGYDISVVDSDIEKLNMLGDDFGGLVIQGVPIDMDILSNAGCKNADVVLVLTPDDSTNIMVTHIVKNYFRIENVYTQIMEPDLEDLYTEFGFKTICPTRFVSDSLFGIVNGLGGNEE